MAVLHKQHRMKSFVNARLNEARQERLRKRRFIGLTFVVAALVLLGGTWRARVGKLSGGTAIADSPATESVSNRKAFSLPKALQGPRFAAQQPVATDNVRAEKPAPQSDPVGLSSDQILAKAIERDPIAQRVPFLAGRSPQKQLEGLKWMASTPDAKFAMAFRDLQMVDMPIEEKIHEAMAMTRDMIADLERQGYRFELAPDFHRIPEDSANNRRADTRIEDPGP